MLSYQGVIKQGVLFAFALIGISTILFNRKIYILGMSSHSKRRLQSNALINWYSNSIGQHRPFFFRHDTNYASKRSETVKKSYNLDWSTGLTARATFTLSDVEKSDILHVLEKYYPEPKTIGILVGGLAFCRK